MPKLRYIHPAHPTNLSSSWILPPLKEVLEDLEICGGNIETFLEATRCLEEQRSGLMYDLLKAIKTDPFVYGQWVSIVATGQEAQQARIANKVYDCIEQNLQSDKPSPAILQFLLKGSAKTNESGRATSSQQSYLNVFGDDAQQAR